jgi:recombination protein RecA
VTSAGKTKKLQMTLIGIQRRWGNKAIGLARSEPTAVPHISTGFSALDDALGMGGIPRGRISEIVGVPTSGMATMALKLIANAQLHKGTAIYMDLERTFDPDYADQCGVNLHQMILIHPYNIPQALAMLPDFIINGGMDILVFDAPLRLQTELHTLHNLSTVLGRLIAPLSKTDCALLFLTTLLPDSSLASASYPQYATLPQYATTRLFIEKEQWLYRQHDVSGYEAQVLIAKNKLSVAGKTARITITFNNNVTRDSP